MKTQIKRILYLAIAALIGIFIGWFFSKSSSDKQSHAHQHEQMTDESTQVWTCSMHPQIRQAEPGKCPLCGMDLIPLDEAQADMHPSAVNMSPTAMKLAEVQTTLVGHQLPAAKGITLTGKITVNEKLISTQPAHIAGRIEGLTVSTTGEHVQKGQTIGYIYAPELIAAQQELLQAKAMETTSPELLEAAKTKLKNQKFTATQIESILEAKQPITRFPLLATTTGYVMNKRVNEGDYVKAGQALLDIAGLHSVWAVLDVYEADMDNIHTEQEVQLEIPALPGKTFTGTIVYIDPVIDPKSRVAHARIELNNTHQQLKPEMLVTAQLATKTTTSDQLVVPKSAVLWTGKRSLVYVKVPAENTTQFNMREVVLGKSIGDYYLIENGLQEGEEIVTQGTFSVDAAAQLSGKPSMMNAATTPSKPQSSENELQPEMANHLSAIVAHYLSLKDALVKDDLSTAQTFANKLQSALNAIDVSTLPHATQKTVKTLQKAIKRFSEENTLETARKPFIALSNTLIALLNQHAVNEVTLYVQHCPMADNNAGADWISTSKDIRNPYFGNSMLQCGSVTDSISIQQTH